MKYPDTSKRFAYILNLRHMKQQELADKAGINKSFISHYVNGTHCPSNIKAQKLADVLNVNPLWLMGLDDNMDAMSKEIKELINLYSNADPENRKLALLALKAGQPQSSEQD